MNANEHERVRQRLIKKYTRIESELSQLVTDCESYVENRTDQDCSRLASDLEEYRVNLAGVRSVLASVLADRPIEDKAMRMLSQGLK